MKKRGRLLSFVMVICMLLNSTVMTVGAKADFNVGISDSVLEEDVELTQASGKNELDPEKGTYNEGVALVKYDGEMNEDVLSKWNLVSATALYSGSSWYMVELAEDADTEETITYLREVGCFDQVDYDYIMGTTDKPEDNPNYKDQVNLGLSNIPYGWTQNGKAPGGSPAVIVAVIDTGVDYNHPDLRNNIWINPAEIPGNGMDDDGNGYIDDVYGWNCVGDNNNPMDDNGHGTHVAGIIAAENNKQGGVGVAYNCKVMVIKAGNSSGYFNNSDIAEAIQYAYMNGASVINMSFGGSNISLAVEEALENAYNACVLVAAAGNDGACNDLSCKVCNDVKVSYPAALPYVIGVMSTDKNGSGISSFSNYDHHPYDSVEYEVYAVGEGVGSTWPSNKYACLNGTSMAAPTVSGIAALLRSEYADREKYSTKFIQSQIVNTGDVYLDGAHAVVDALQALTTLPKPAVNLYDYYIDDSVSISNMNNGNGVIDAGETVRLYISLHNRGGVASDVNVSIDTYRSGIGAETLTDPYFTFVNSTIHLSDIGTYSVRESGDKYFEIIVDEKCPNDYLVDFNIRFTYKNGLDDNDNTVYEGRGEAKFRISKGYHLPNVISEDIVYRADKLYIVGDDVTILEGVSVTFEEGCEIQFYDDREYYDAPCIKNYGNLVMNGTKERMIEIHPNEMHINFGCSINNFGSMEISYAKMENCALWDKETTSKITVSDSVCLTNPDDMDYVYTYSGGNKVFMYYDESYSLIDCYQRNYIEFTGYRWSVRGEHMEGNYIVLSSNGRNSLFTEKLENNIIFTVHRKSMSDLSHISIGSPMPDLLMRNNMFLSENSLSSLHRIYIETSQYYDRTIEIDNNAFSEFYQKYASQVINNYQDSTGKAIIDVFGACSDISKLYPHVVRVEIFDKEGNAITTVGREEIKVRVTFNRAMDTSQNTSLTFGTIAPYADYRINGEWISETIWEGSYTLKAQIENGQNFLKVNNACAAEDFTKVVLGEYHLHEFTIDTTEAMSMNLLAFPEENGIELKFEQDDYDTLLGYNIYRASSKDGNYVKLNPAVLPPTDSTFLDENAEPGKTYWYTYTVVLTDFTESAPAGRVAATATDTLAPNMYHTPVNQGYMNNNIIISCTASDNVAISTVTLYYRAVGESEWKTLTMSKQSDKYSATIFCNEFTLDGVEYYIVASDGRNTINKGTAETPYTIVVKDASAISHKGDVDGDGIVTTKDALMLMQRINGDLILSDDEFKRADLNGDNRLNTSEALRILQYINGNVSTLEM